jgi:cyanophycin synthetase
VNFSRTNQLIIAAAESLGVTVEPISADPTDYFLRLRHGDRSVVISKTRSPHLSQVAQTLSNNKHVSRELLAARGIPVVPDQLVDAQPELESIRELVAPWLARFGSVVVKPNWGNRARGVAVELERPEQVLAAVSRAQAVDVDEEAIVEPYLAGTNIRVSVVGGRVEAAAQIFRPRLIGDGSTSLRTLVDRLNEDPRRGSWERPGLESLDQIELEDDFVQGLALRGLSTDQPLPASVAVELLTDELETADFTDALHPTWAEAARLACATLGVDVGGVDLRGPASSFERPMSEAGSAAALLEVNVLPALHVHALPTLGQARPVFEAFVAYCLGLDGAPPPQPGPQI